MHSGHATDPIVSEESRQAGHETTDVSGPAMVRWGIGLIMLIVGSMLAMLILYIAFGGPFQRRPTASTENRLQPWPRLQSNPLKDLAQFEREQAELDAGYAWVDPTQGRVRIPTVRAMDIVVERGLPKWQSAQASEGGGR